MSALEQLLAQHAADINARIEHTNDVDNEISERKANTLEEKFQHAKDAIEGVGTELATAGTAFHMGRKIYTKYKARQARLAKEKTGGGDSESNTSAERPAADGEAPTRPAAEEPAAEDKPGTAPAQGEGDAITETDTFFPDRTTGNADADNIFRDDPGNLKLKARQKAEADAEAKEPESHTEPKPSEAQPAQDTSDPATAQGQESRAANIESGQAEAPTGTTEANPMDALNTRQATPLQESGSEPSARPTSEANVGSSAEGAGAEGGGDVGGARAASQAGSAADDVEEGARAFMDPETGAARAASNIASRAADNSSIIDKGINGAKKVGSALKSGLGGDASDAASSILPEVGEALDFLGPIGEFAGLITGLVGLFEGLGHKKEEPKPISGQTGDIAPQQAGGGIDPAALLASQPKGVMAAV